MEHEAVELRASPHAVLALTEGITHYRVDYLPGGRGDVGAVWFQGGQLYVAKVDILGLAFKFEVFTLALQTPTASLGQSFEPASFGNLEDWPFQTWQLDILKRMEFLVGPEHLPETASEMQEYFRTLRPGEAALGSEHTCLTAIGLLFTSDDGRRLLVVADGMPGSMRVTDDEETVQSYFRQCIVIPADEYVSHL